jgi:hypothetical protein
MKFRTLLLGLSALFVAFNAAFFSVSGLSKLFAGASLSVILMASSLELAKLITAGYLYNYWTKINKIFRWYLVTGVVVLVLITSLGIYGFLTAAFQETFNIFSITEKQRTFLQQKEKFWADDVARYDEELKRISDNISTLSNARSSSIQVRDTSVVGGVRNTISTTELRLAQQRIGVEEENRKDVQAKREVAADSLQSIQLRILDLDTDTEVSSELGPLQYLSGLTGYGMDKIINWLILIIIFVFDPLAVALVVAFNNAIKVDKGIVKKEKVIRKRELYDEVPEEEEEELTELQKTLLMDVESEEVLPDEARGVNPPSKEEIEKKSLIQQALKNESKKETINDGYNLTEEEVEEYYQKEGWKKPYNGKPYYVHPRFDWDKKERWINDRNAINYWMKKKGGTTQELRELKEKYPSDFTSKTY